jgi:hypothetical protein
MHEHNDDDMDTAQSALRVEHARFTFKPCLTLDGIDPEHEGIDELSISIVYKPSGWIEVSTLTNTRLVSYLVSPDTHEGFTIEQIAHRSAIEMLERVTGSEGLGKDYSVYSIFITRD